MPMAITLFRQLLLALALAHGAALAAPIDLSPVPARPSAVELPKHWHRGVFMEVFVRAYQDSDGDGIGDLKGLISRLDYLQDLGIKGLWLMPIQANADGDHGYATRDFRAVAPEYGTLADVDRLLAESAKRGIGVIIDYAINHAAAQHPAFVAARADRASPWRDWFVFADEEPKGWEIWGKNPWYANRAESWGHAGEAKDTPRPSPGTRDWYFGTFGPQMPDFNLRHPPVLAYHEDSLRFWLNRGLGGFRLDATPHLVENSAKDWNDQPESRAMTQRIADMIRAYPNRYVVCEATAKPQEWGDMKVCGGAFAFGYTQHFIDAARGKPEAVVELADYYKTASPAMATFLSNHDIFAGRRLWDQLDGDVARYKLAAAGYLLQPGTPFIYYGEEVGQAGAVGSGIVADQPLRAPMSWSADGGFSSGRPFRPHAANLAAFNAQAQQRDPTSIHAFYKAMIGLRNARPSIARGSFEHAFADGAVLGFQRTLDRERTLVLINYGREARRVRVAGLFATSQRAALYPARGRTHRGAFVTLPARSVRVYGVQR
jgi:alpha-amylase